jgi:hypothetical protein
MKLTERHLLILALLIERERIVRLGSELPRIATFEPSESFKG